MNLVSCNFCIVARFCKNIDKEIEIRSVYENGLFVKIVCFR